MTVYERREKENRKRRDKGIARARELIAKGWEPEKVGRYVWTWYSFLYQVKEQKLTLAILGNGWSQEVIAEIEL